MFLTIIILALTGLQFLKRAKRTNLLSGKIFAYGLFFVALAILFYSVRDVFIQFGLYEIQEKLLVIGGLVHLVGAYFILYFIVKEFGPKSYFKHAFNVLFGFVLFGFGLFLSGMVFKLGSEIGQAPLEPLPYLVVRNYVSDPAGVFVLYGLVALISLLVLGIIGFSSYRVKEKSMRIKGLLYGLGTWFLIAPIIICAVLSPIFARIGYLIGAFLIYEAFKKKK